MIQIEEIQINTVHLVNDGSEHDSIARLGQSTLPNGVSSAATTALVRLTCQAHDTLSSKVSKTYLNVHLEELRKAMLIIWYGNDKVGLV